MLWHIISNYRSYYFFHILGKYFVIFKDLIVIIMSSMKAQEDISFKRNVFTIQVLRVMCLLKNSLTFRSYYIGYYFSILK